MTVLLQEDFTGANGAAWSTTNWQTPLSPQTAAGTTFTIQSNAGRVSTPGSFGGGARNTTLAARADVVIQATLTPPTAGNIRFMARERANGQATDDRLAVGLVVNQAFGEIQLTDYTVGQFFPNQPAADRKMPIPAAGASGKLVVEMVLAGANGEVRVWTPETSRPATAQLVATNLTNVSGNIGIAVGSQNATTFDVDSITISDTLSTGPPPTTTAGLPAGVIHDWSASNAVVSGGVVDSVPDAGGSPVTLTQTLSKRPTYVLSGIGGKPSVDFDGVDDSLVASTATAPQYCTYLHVIDFDDVAALGQVQWASSQHEIYPSGAQLGLYGATTGFAFTLPNRNAAIIVANFQADTSKFVQNGTTVATGTTASSSAATNFYLGQHGTAGRYAKMRWARTIVWDHTLTDQEIADASSVMSSVYGITVAGYIPPAGVGATILWRNAANTTWERRKLLTRNAANTAWVWE